MDVGLISRVGLQLLLEPQSTAFIARGACLGAGVLYPAYATYKTLVVPKRAAASGSPRSPPPPSSAASVHSLAGERWLKYWALFGLTVVAERMLDTHLDRIPFYPHAKLAFFLWLQANQGHGASLLFDGYLTPWLCRYERKLDTLLEVGAQIMATIMSTYAGPISHLRTALTLGLTQLASFIKWLTTPDDAPPGVDGQHSSSSSSRSPGAAGRRAQNLIH